MDKLLQCIEKYKKKAISNMKDKRFWLLQILDVIIVVILFLCYVDMLPLVFAGGVIALYVIVHIYFSLKKAYKTSKTITEKGKHNKYGKKR